MTAESDRVSSPLVSIVIPCYNQALFLQEAIESARAQTHGPREIVVVDDGSTDQTAEVARRVPGVHYVRQTNRGLAAARNTGIRESGGAYLVFLDADDRLLPGALEAGLACFREDPGSAFVWGRYRYINGDGSVRREWSPPNGKASDGYLALLRGNDIGMHATVMYRRDVLESVGGFDPTLAACEDYDVYLRIARGHPIRRHHELVAEYRQHDGNMSRDSILMRRMALTVLGRQWVHARDSAEQRAAYRTGVARWKRHYEQEMIQQLIAQSKARGTSRGVLAKAQALWRIGGVSAVLRSAGRSAVWRWMPRLRPYLERGVAMRVLAAAARRLAARRGHDIEPPAVGRVRLGDLRRITPISRDFGYGRGQPVDRHYIEAFLARHASDVRGRVLEIGDDAYTRAYGGARVTRSDILHVSDDNPRATCVGDLARADHLPSTVFDCVILTQTLHLIYDVRAALDTIHRILKPGGVLLATVPGVSQIDHGEWGSTWYWSFTVLSARRLLEETFAEGDIRVEAYGNVLAAVAFLHGLATHEVTGAELDHRDAHYPVIVTMRARKAASGRSRPA